MKTYSTIILLLSLFFFISCKKESPKHINCLNQQNIVVDTLYWYGSAFGQKMMESERRTIKPAMYIRKMEFDIHGNLVGDSSALDIQQDHSKVLSIGDTVVVKIKPRYKLWEQFPKIRPYVDTTSASYDARIIADSSQLSSLIDTTSYIDPLNDGYIHIRHIIDSTASLRGVVSYSASFEHTDRNRLGIEIQQPFPILEESCGWQPEIDRWFCFIDWNIPFEVRFCIE